MPFTLGVLPWLDCDVDTRACDTGGVPCPPREVQASCPAPVPLGPPASLLSPVGFVTLSSSQVLRIQPPSLAPLSAF